MFWFQVVPFKKMLQKADNESCPEYAVPSESVDRYRSMYSTGEKSWNILGLYFF